MQQLAGYNHSFNLVLEVEADGGLEARERSLAWIEAACKAASEWRGASEVVFDDEVENGYDGETHEIAQFLRHHGRDQR